MRTITAITPQTRNRQRVNIFLDGEFAFGLSRIVAAWLQVGQTLSEEKIAELQAADECEVAYQRALKLLSYRPRTQAEVRQHLHSHGASEAVIESVVQRLKENGLLDDAHFAALWVENRRELRPRSRRFLAYELRQHGVSAPIIESALAEVDEAQLAEQAARRKMRKLNLNSWPEFKAALYRYLKQRGFQYDTIQETVARLWVEQQSPPHTEEAES